MQFSLITALLYLTAITSATPLSDPSTLSDLSIRSEDSSSSSIPNQWHAFEKRKGGGGGGGKGGGGSSSSGGSRSGTSGSGSRSYSYQSNSNLGGRTTSGSGTKPLADGKYAGGATVPYTAGAPVRGVAPYAVGAGALAIWPIGWGYGYAWGYPYGYPYHYGGARNQTANITCLCEQYSVCGCDDQGNSTFATNLINNGTDGPKNSTLVRFVDHNNGTAMAYINGSLANGTTAPGGTDPSNDAEAGSAARLANNLASHWIMIALVGATVYLV